MKKRMLASGMLVSSLGLGLIAAHEGLRTTAYDDGTGTYTLGAGATTREDGTPVQPGDTTTPARAIIKLESDARRTERLLSDCLGPVKLYQHEWDAYVSLAYNVGPGAVCASTIKPKLRAGRYEAACQTILSFNKARACPTCPKVVWRGLTARRQAEYRLCMYGVTP